VYVEGTRGGTNLDGGVESSATEKKNIRYDRRTTGDSAVGFRDQQRDLLEGVVVRGVLISP